MTDLSDRGIWLVDNDIPVQELPFEKDALLKGMRPIDCSALAYLVEKSPWGAAAILRDVVKQLLDSGADLLAFLHPQAAVAHLERFRTPPDIIVFDLLYDGTAVVREETLRCLNRILAENYSLIQIYTSRDVDEAERKVGDLLARYPRRLARPKRKGAITSGDLAGMLSGQLTSSLSAHLGRPVRKASADAIEAALVRIGSLPLKEAMQALTSSGREEAEATEEGLAELLSEKMMEALRGDGTLREAIGRAYAETYGACPDIEGLVALIISRVGSYILRGSSVHDSIVEALAMVGAAGETADAENIERAVREFFAFRLYDRIKTNRVQTGDIVEVSLKGVEKSEGELAMVVTAPCDLQRFWRNTAGHLTLVRLLPLDLAVKMMGKRRRSFRESGSITARDPFGMPSVPLGSDYVDCVLFPRQLFSLRVEKPEGDSSAFLSYEDVGKATKMECVRAHARVSQPFLTGILNKVAGLLFRAGVPDYPSSEKRRISAAVEDFGSGTE